MHKNFTMGIKGPYEDSLVDQKMFDLLEARYLFIYLCSMRYLSNVTFFSVKTLNLLEFILVKTTIEIYTKHSKS